MTVIRYELRWDAEAEHQEMTPTALGGFVTYGDYEKVIAALKLMCQARDSYSNEFNPGNKVKGIADWGLINEAWCAADSILANG